MKATCAIAAGTKRSVRALGAVFQLSALGTLVELIVLACLIAVPENCHEEHLRFSMEPVAGQACMVGAPPLLAQWSMSRPAWRVARWRCGIPGAEGYGI